MLGLLPRLPPCRVRARSLLRARTLPPQAPAQEGANLTGLNWNGDPAGRRAVVFTSPLTAYPATYLWKVYQRNQITRSPNSRYYTTFFHGNNGTFDGFTNYGQAYYGGNPYPVDPPSGDGKWSISANSTDKHLRDDGTSDPYITNDKWYSQALVVSNPSTLNHKLWIDLPSTASVNTITQNFVGTYTTPPSPCIIWGQAPDVGGVSWGGYVDWEEQNAIIRGVQIYSTALTEAQVVALGALETDAEVLAYCTANSITSLWYLNMNWTTTDISDKSGSSHNPSFVSTNSAMPADASCGYYTTFDTAQNPLSEGGKWIRQATSWTSVETSGGVARAAAYTDNYDDAYAILDAWSYGNDYEIVATVYNPNGLTTGEVELLLRCSDSSSQMFAYECLFGIGGALQLVRWNGNFQSFTVLTENEVSTPPAFTDGYQVRATVVGTMIRTYARATPTAAWAEISNYDFGSDGTKYLTGKPGIAFYVHTADSNRTLIGLKDVRVMPL